MPVCTQAERAGLRVAPDVEIRPRGVSGWLYALRSMPPSTRRSEHGDDQSQEEEGSHQARTGYSTRPRSAEEAKGAWAPSSKCVMRVARPMVPVAGAVELAH